MKPGLPGKPGSQVPVPGEGSPGPGARGKLMPAAGGRKTHSYTNFMHLASSKEKRKAIISSKEESGVS